VAARDSPVAPVGVERGGLAGGAFCRSADRGLGEAGFEERELDRPREIEGHALRMRPQRFARKFAGHFGAHGVTTGMDAGTDLSQDLGRWNAPLAQEADRACGNSASGAAPSGMEERTVRPAPRHEGDRRAVRGGDRRPWISRLDQKAVRVFRRLLRCHDPRAVNLPDAKGSRIGHAERVEEEISVPEHVVTLVAHPQSQVERSVGAATHASTACGNSEPRCGRKASFGGPPHQELLAHGFLRHVAKVAPFHGAAQALGFAIVLGLAFLGAGCARLPKAGSGTAARDRFLSVYAATRGAERGVGSISIRRGEEGRGNARARWGANAESLAVVGYVGPARVLDAALKGDSLYLVIRRYGMGVSGTLRGEEGMDGRILRFAATPWDFSPAWVRQALERAAMHESGKGWRLEGSLGADGDRGGGGEYRFVFELSERGEPLSLLLRRAGGSRELITVRYGPERRYEAGRIPSWIEWSFSGSVVTLKIEDHAPADPAKIRYAPPAEPGWTILSLDDPAGRSLVRWLLGLSEGGAEP